MTTLLVVRHAEVHNPRNILYGRLPGFGLSDKGREQAAETARFLSTRPVAAIYSSPLLRARQTADIIAATLGTVERHVTKRLLETRTGYQGASNDVIKPGFSFYEPPAREEDESMQAVWERMSAFLRAMRRRHAGETIVAVSHADPIAIVYLGLSRRPLTPATMHASLYPARSSVTQIVFGEDASPTITYFNVVGSPV
ncbi:MAG TPA: histidine phosphatase family protein [Chloroflexota bacterium]|nr:histidine phosphatase family protein [Chloroflexota bacterium]